MTEPAQRVDVDVIVVGMGPGGEDAAGRLAEAGLTVVGIERHLVGGECPYWGCVPSKMMIRAANSLAEARRVDRLAGSAIVHPDWAPVAARIRSEATDSWDDEVAATRFEDKGGRLVRGDATVVGPGAVRVDETVYRAGRALILASGSAPAIPPIDGLAETPFWTNHEAIELERLPESLIVLGGGAIGMELTQVFARFGVEVTVVEAQDRVLSPEEPEASAVVAHVVEAEGVTLRTGVAAEKVAHDGSSFSVTLADGDVLTSDSLLVVTGRRVDLTGLGVAALGVDDSARALEVDERCRVVPGVWALGDLTGAGAFTHVAMYQSDIVVSDIMGTKRSSADYRVLPRVTFTDPEVGSVGMTERQAREAGMDVGVGLAELPSTARGWIHGVGNEGLIKVVVDRSRDVLVGATVVAPAGGEVMAALAVAIAAGTTVTALREMIWAYPSFSRGILDALSAMD